MGITETPLERAIRFAGSARALAAAIGCVPSSITKARYHGVSAKMALAIEAYTEGFVRREELAPQHFPAPLPPRPVTDEPIIETAPKSIRIFK